MAQELTAGLAKRLAEAADGFRDGKYYYFVSKLNYDYDVHWASGDTDTAASAAADDLLSQLGNEYQKYGPYRTESYDDPPLLDFDSIELKLTKQGLTPIVITIPQDSDAIVLSLSAFDKFFLPYYTRLYGVEVAADFRSQAIDTLSNFLTPRKVPTHGNVTSYITSTSSQSVQS